MSTYNLLFGTSNKRKMVRQIPTSFDGKHDLTGFSFYQLLKSRKAYMYKVTDHNTREVHCEVFERQTYEPENREMYPPEEAYTGKLVKTKNAAKAQQIWIEMSK